jgi:hypothetical protein
MNYYFISDDLQFYLIYVRTQAITRSLQGIIELIAGI